MPIIGDAIIYSDHAVILANMGNFGPSGPIYLQEMRDELQADGSKRDHGRALREMNNDGSWHIKPIIIHRDKRYIQLSIINHGPRRGWILARPDNSSAKFWLPAKACKRA